MKLFHLATESGKNAKVLIGRPISSRVEPMLLTASKEETFTETIHRGDKPMENPTAAALIEGDPEIDTAHIGMILEGGSRAFREPTSKKIVGDFQKFVTVYAKDGSLKEKTAYVPKKANIDDALPIKMGKRMPIAEAFGKFVFHNQYALGHDDGLKFEFLAGIAKDLWEKKEMAALGSGAKGNGPLIFLDGGTPYRAFLYGETQDDKYRLIVLVTRMELKTPEPTDAAAKEAAQTEQATA